MAFFAIAPLLFALVQNEIQMTLYIHQVLYGPAANQPSVAMISGDKYFGQTFVQDWPVRDGPDPSADKVIGHAQGISMIANQTSKGTDMYTSFNLVFTDERFGGSTLQITGIHYYFNNHQGHEWSIVGGTGEFTMARGVAKYQTIVKPDKVPGSLYKVNVHAYYSSMDSTAVSGKSACNSKTSEPIAVN